MNLQIASLLVQDGITNGAIYALLALSIVLVFTVTRILIVQQGEFVAYGALTTAAFEAGKSSAVVWLLLGLSLLSALLDVVQRWRMPQTSPGLGWLFAAKLIYPTALVLLLYQLPLADISMVWRMVLTLALLVPLGPLHYHVVYQPIASAPSLNLLIVSIAVHVAMLGMGLLFFGAEGASTTPLIDHTLEWGSIRLKAQALIVMFVTCLFMVSLFILFSRTLYGKALRAAAMNRVGARLMGISPQLAGKATFTLAALIGALSGILIAPMTTTYYDSGFLISLKGFVGAILGGLVSYPLAVIGALLLGLMEAFSAFFASGYTEIIVFTLIIPALLWRSLRSHATEDEE